MAINYKITACSNPAGDEGVDYACCRETKSGMLMLNDLAEDISHATTITPTDVRHIIEDFIYALKRHVNNGESVVLEELGTFTTRLRSRCFKQSAMTSATFAPASYIDGTKTSFRASADFKKYVREYATYKRLPSELMA
mgnify:FL=1